MRIHVSLSYGLAIISALLLPMVEAQTLTPHEVLERALHKADLYNWADAAADFAAAEAMFTDLGDHRNALYARLGKIRATADENPLPEISLQLARELEENPLLQQDKQLRMFASIVKGDIDGEVNATDMRRSWEQVAALAREIGDVKWQYRSKAQLGIAAFYDGDLATAGQSVAAALMQATMSHDVGAQIRFLTTLGAGLVEARMCDQALPYFEKALAASSNVTDAGYPYLTQQARVQAMLCLKRFDAAQQIATEALKRAEQNNRAGQQAAFLLFLGQIARAQNDESGAVTNLERSARIYERAGFRQPLPAVQAELADIYRASGQLKHAEQYAALAAATSQATGQNRLLPDQLRLLAELLVSEGKYSEADEAYSRAGAFVDALVGNFTTVLEKTALIRASSRLYTQHFALIADHFNNTARAFSIIEQVRGRVVSDLLAAGGITSERARAMERSISLLRLKLMTARSNTDVRRIRDQIFAAEQNRWVTPDVSILKSSANKRVALSEIEKSLESSSAILEYVLADPHSFVLIITRGGSRIARLEARTRIESHVTAYLSAVRARQGAEQQARTLYDDLLRPVTNIAAYRRVVVVPDGQVHLLPLDALIDPEGRYVVERQIVTYAPSASALYLLTSERDKPRRPEAALLAVGGVPYDPQGLRKLSRFRGVENDAMSSLPASRDEVLAARDAFPGRTTLLLGDKATESALKKEDLRTYSIVHLAVHGVADRRLPERSALVLLSDPSAGEDGFLQAPEIVQLPLRANLIILSACDTGVGRIEDQEGIATLSRAFLLAGGRGTVSTLWAIDDVFSEFLMKRFYARLVALQPVADALAGAKRDMLRRYGTEALPYYWAAFTYNGAIANAVIVGTKKGAQH
jgi:CHAT domain-containing protein